MSSPDFFKAPSMGLFTLQYRVLLVKIHCGVEQLVARWAHNPKVIGSSPVPATRKGAFSAFFFASNLAYLCKKELQCH